MQLIVESDSRMSQVEEAFGLAAAASDCRISMRFEVSANPRELFMSCFVGKLNLFLSSIKRFQAFI